jgi:AAA+ superfamily predicted ATPase
MRGFGFLSASDAAHRLFIERSAAMHGVPQLSLDGTFLFFGPAREDVSLFAHATAGEIGFPVLHISVDLDAQGNGTIKLVGPFKRGLFGNPPDFMDMVTPCTVLIENIDLLQEMFNNEQQALRRGGAMFRGMMGMPARSMQAEMTGYLRALRQKSDIVIMATAQHIDTLREPLKSLLGVIHEIEVAAPREDERRAVLIGFAGEHPSFAELDISRIAQLSEGLSRNELVRAAHAAVEAAYRGSLRTGRYNRVTLGDVMVQLAPFLDHESSLYQQVEDEAVVQLARDLEEDMYQNQ